MHVNSHATMRLTRSRGARLVPHEALPLGPDGRELPPPEDWAERGEREQRQREHQEAHAAAVGGCAGRHRWGNVTAAAAAVAAAGGGGGGGAGEGGAGAVCGDSDGGGTGLRPPASERDRFELLRLPYREPHQRNA
ncbi:hypothetical protein TSOC_008751 [Tetrabaena socialis]|uniref:Uncharacterized protein n=1 Tax=Tetrabaena socialis TaxID=47790 RepID=A0A2J7ZXN6_9CHLO|nr:hypothetical protein TSOC_008751 [Tetrabaena socialis]|eukprot:PNH05031.1 hypothetical protein TSOC_008751 [Tetrabaena socialis]